MRSLLYVVARYLVGFATLLAVIAVFEGAPVSVIVSDVAFWMFAVLVGMALSIPMRLWPSSSVVAPSPGLPLALRLVMLPLRLLGFVGDLVIRGGWAVLGRVWRRIAAGSRSRGSGAPFW